jgi:hypothetical protein
LTARGPVTARPALTYTVNVTEPWTRQPRESEVQHAWFLHYRDQAYPDGPTGDFKPRSVRVVAEDFGYPYVTISGVAESFAWAPRAAAYDALLLARKAEAAMDALEALAVAHGRALGDALEIARLELAKLRGMAEGQAPALKPKELITLLEKTITLQRLLADQATSIVKTDQGLDLTQLSDEDLEAYEQIMSKAKVKK